VAIKFPNYSNLFSFQAFSAKLFACCIFRIALNFTMRYTHL